MHRNSYLDAGEDFIPPGEVGLVTCLALIGIVVPLVAFATWRYAVNELRGIDEGTLRADRRRSIDHARSLAKIVSIVYLIGFVVALGMHA